MRLDCNPAWRVIKVSCHGVANLEPEMRWCEQNNKPHPEVRIGMLDVLGYAVQIQSHLSISVAQFWRKFVRSWPKETI